MDYESTIALTLGAITDDRAPLSDETFNNVCFGASILDFSMANGMIEQLRTDL